MKKKIKKPLQIYNIKIYPFQIKNIIKYKNTINNIIILPIIKKSTQYHIPYTTIIYHQNYNNTTKNIQNFIQKTFNISKKNKLLKPLYIPQIIIKFKKFPLTSNNKPNKHTITKTIKHKLNNTKYNYIH